MAIGGIQGGLQKEVTIPVGQKAEILNIANCYLLTAEIFIEQSQLLTASVPATSLPIPNTVQLNVINWKNGMVEAVILNTENPLKVIRNYPTNNIMAINNYNVSITLYVSYTIATYDEAKEEALEAGLTSILGSVNVLSSSENPIYITQSAGFAGKVFTGTIKYLLPITLYNNQSSPVTAGFQQLVPVNSLSYNAYEAADLKNINFQDGYGNILYSWLESGETNSDMLTNYWVVLPSGISSNSNIVIYMCFGDPIDNLMDGVHTGAEPDYTATYGQYDNGSYVFDTYDNFTGSSLNAMWNTQSQGAGSIVVSDGLFLTTTNLGDYASIVSTATTLPLISEAHMSGITATSPTIYGGVFQSKTPTMISVV
jgi:hypothetical protein